MCPTFEPPVVYDNPAILPTTKGVQRALFKYYGPYPRGRSVLKINGVYQTVDYPDQLTLATATEVYLGGHKYEVDGSTATGLLDAGYALSSVVFSTPDTVANSITGDIDIRMRLTLDWADTTSYFPLIGKGATDSSGYQLMRYPAPFNLALFISFNGVSSSSMTSGGTLPFAQGTAGWVRATRVQATGVHSYYTSLDGITWTPLGTPGGLIPGGSIFDSSADLKIGHWHTLPTTYLLNGTVHYAEVRSGIDGTVVNYFDPEDLSAGGPWTINDS
jgi:hypothetical protein